MNILSIDVGIKNLAYCIIQIQPNMMYKIIKWDIINLCGNIETCGFITKKGLCGNKSKYYKNNKFYCKIHSKKSNFLLPTSEILKVKQKNTKISDLIKIAEKHNIVIDKSFKKSQISEEIIKYMDKNMLDCVKDKSANNMDLVSIGIALKNELEKNIIHEELNYVIIENQISPIANRMKSIQGMIAQYFIMNNITNIIFVSSSNKLKEFIGNKTTTYSERKKIGINITTEILEKNELNNKWLPVVLSNNKKDDLADSFLQGLWFLKNKNLIKI